MTAATLSALIIPRFAATRIISSQSASSGTLEVLHLWGVHAARAHAVHP